MKTSSLRKLSPILAILATTALLPTKADAAIITLQNGVSPTGAYSGATSTFIRSDNPTTNYINYLNPTSSQFVVGNTSAGADIRGLLSFDLSLIPAGATINSVTLTLTTAAADGTSTNAMIQLNIVSLTTTFIASQATWTNATTATPWTTPGGDFSPTVLSSTSLNPVTTPGGTSATFASSASFVSLVQSVYNGSKGLDLMVKLDDETGLNRNIFFFVGDGTTPTASFRPSLTIDYTAVPEPSTGAMIGAGLLIAILVRRRR